MGPSSLFSRAEVLGGLTAGRARTLLFLIESRSARLAAEARQAMAPFRSEQAAADDDLAYITAFAEGRDPPRPPSIQDLEHFAAQWQPLVPREPRIQAAVGHALAAKYRFTYDAVPGIRSALGLDEGAVQEAFLRQYGDPIASLYQRSPGGGRERLRWAWARLARWLDALPPFWTSFALTLTETVGAGTLALPIALAGIGPLPGIVLMIVLGLVNVATIVGEAEAAARSGTVRYGLAYMGRMVRDYLGNYAGVLATTAVAILNFLTLPAYFIGFGATMAGFTGLPEPAWVIALFLACLYFLRRESLDATVGSALMVGAVNIAIVVLLSLLAFVRLDPANLLYINVPFVAGRPFEPSVLALIFGVILVSFFGHVSVTHCARIVLRRDTSARSLIAGAAVAQVVAIAVYSVWCLAVAGAVAPAALQAETGTALAPLSNRIGPIAVVLSTIYAVLALAMSSVHSGLGLFNIVRERLPTLEPLTVRLPLRDGRLILSPRRSLRDLRHADGRINRVDLTYLGLAGSRSQAAPCPRLRLAIDLGGQLRVLDFTLDGAAWDQSALAGLLPDRALRGIRVSLEVAAADPGYLHLRVTSPMALRYEGRRESAGLDLAALLELPDPERHVWTWLSRQRQPASLGEIAARARVDEAGARALVQTLIQAGLATEDLADDPPRYHARYAPRRGRTFAARLQNPEASPRTQDRGNRGGEKIRAPLALGTGLGVRGRYVLCALPVVVAFLLTEYLLLSGQASFSGVFGLTGVLTVPLLGGFFPVLLLVAARRKGDVVPGAAPRFAGHPLVLALIYLLFLAGLFVQGLLIAQGQVERLAALAVAVLAIAMPIVMLRRGIFRRRAVIEMCTYPDQERPAVFAVSAAGRPRAVEVQLRYEQPGQWCPEASGEIQGFAGLRMAGFRSLPGSLPVVRDLKVWTHALTLDGDDRPLPATAQICSGDLATTCDLAALGGQVVVPLADGAFAVQVAFAQPSEDPI